MNMVYGYLLSMKANALPIVDNPEVEPKKIVAKEEPVIPVNGTIQMYVGGLFFILALIGIAFYFMAGPATSPALLFMPIVLLAIGAGGLVFGALTLNSTRK